MAIPQQSHQTILSDCFLEGHECARLACTTPLWSEAAGSNKLWQEFVLREYPREAENINPDGKFFRDVYRKEFTLRQRAKCMWQNIEGWCEENAPRIGQSLQGGATDEEIEQAEAELGLRLPSALRAIYRVHDGQLLSYDVHLDDEREVGDVQPDSSVYAGLFGGYSFYNHFVCTRMLPLKRIVRWTRWMRGSRQKHNPDEQYWVLFAASYVFNKVFFVDTRDASVFIWTVDRVHVMRAVPENTDPGERYASLDMLHLHQFVDCQGVCDGVVRWMEAYSQRLLDGTYRLQRLLDDGEQEHIDPSIGICLFPAKEPRLASEVTMGVKVRTSSLFAPELSMVPTTGPPTFTIAYCVEFSLLPEDEEGNPSPHRRCKLRSRHFTILAADGQEAQSVSGAAVIGKYPDLELNAPAFHYQSCTRQYERGGSMEGHFMFADISSYTGKIDHAQPPPFKKDTDFRVECPRFQTQVPDIIF